MIRELGEKAKKAAGALRCATFEKRNGALRAMADALLRNTPFLLDENRADLAAGKAAGMPDSMLDRLALDENRITAMADGIRQVAELPDPLGRVLNELTRPNGLQIKKISVPLGVIGIIYESRPNVTADAAALCLKSGNAVILRGGKEAVRSNLAIGKVLREAVQQAGIPGDAVQVVADTTRESANEMMRLNGLIDVLIPRGGASLIRSVVEHATVPIIETGTGNCHIYIDACANLQMATDVVYNAKTSRVSVCNSCESLVVHRAVAKEVLPLIRTRLMGKNVELRGDAPACAILPDILPATETDFATEYLDYILSIKTVDSLEEAIVHINRYSTGHSEAIITEDPVAAERFLVQVDSAAVYVNASTRFTDGGEFGEGAEIGISTQKLHARGPMGVNQLTSTKFVIHGAGQVRE